MDSAALAAALDLLIDAARMKRLPRTGWLMRGVPSPESLAGHSHGVSLTALLLLDLVEADLDRARVLSMAILHDLPECRTGDLPTPAGRSLPRGAKAAMETAIFDELAAGAGDPERWRDLWREFEAAETPEARLVRDADKLDMFVQALLYRRAGHGEVDQFWDRRDDYPWAYPESRQLLAYMFDNLSSG